MSSTVPLVFHSRASIEESVGSVGHCDGDCSNELIEGISSEVTDLIELQDQEWDPQQDFKDALRERSGKLVMERLVAAAELNRMPTDKILRMFIGHLKQSFTTSEKNISAHVWNDLRKRPEFETVINAYVRETLPHIFANKYSQSLYDDIEFGLFLLGSSDGFDVLGDIRHSGAKGVGVLFNDRHSQIARDLSGVKVIQEKHRLRLMGTEEASEQDELSARFERNIEAFEQLCELINKIAAINSINVFNKATALSLAQMIGAQVESVEHDLSDIAYDDKILRKLRFLEGKLLGNYSHLEYFDGESASEIMRKAHKIASAIRGWLDLMRASNFGDVPGRESIATSVCRGNEAFIMLVAFQKIADIGQMDAALEITRKEWESALFELYGTASKLSKRFDSPESVINDFAARPDHDEFMIETVHHVVLFSSPSEDALIRLVEHLINDKEYHNVYHEEFKIKLFSVILEKFERIPASARLLVIANKIRDYSLKHEKLSGLVTSFSQLYLSLAIYLAGLKSEAPKKLALECFIRFSRIAEDIRSVKFERHKTLFLERIGGREEMEKFEKIHSLEKEKEIHERVLSMVAQAANGELSDKIDRRICQVIEELFYGTATADIRRCFRWGKCSDCKKINVCLPDIDPKWIRRGNRPQSIAINREHYLLLQYPANLEEVFQRIYEKREDFIQVNLSSLLAIGMTNQELTGANRRLNEANRKLDYQVRTDLLTGLPNMTQFDEDAARLESEPEVFSMLVKIQNLADVNESYGIDVGDAFLRDIATRLFPEIFFGDDWRVYHVSKKEFAIIGTFPFSKNAHITPESLVENFWGLASDFRFQPYNKSGLVVRAQMVFSYSDSLRTDLYQKLHIALSDGTKKNVRAMKYHPETHSEKSALSNIEGGILVAEAIEQGRVVPFYQAIVHNVTGRVAKVECLARIIGKDGSVIPPFRFIDHAKQTNLLPELTKVMFDRACEEMRHTDMDFSINISWQDLTSPDLVRMIQDTCARREIEPSRVTIEILEEALASNQKEFEVKIAELKALGCKIALDDFGSEGSNFSRFNKAWWPDVIKIDGQFIKDIDKDEEKLKIVKSIVAAAKVLGCELVAEFVDNEKVWSIVRDLGIHYTQGFLFHKPSAITPESPLPKSFDFMEMGIHNVRTRIRDVLKAKKGQSKRRGSIRI